MSSPIYLLNFNSLYGDRDHPLDSIGLTLGLFDDPYMAFEHFIESVQIELQDRGKWNKEVNDNWTRCLTSEERFVLLENYLSTKRNYKLTRTELEYRLEKELLYDQWSIHIQKIDNSRNLSEKVTFQNDQLENDKLNSNSQINDWRLYLDE